MQSETLSLNEVSSELLGEKKKEFDFLKIKKMSQNDWRDFFEYNLHDSYLTYRLFEKIWPDISEFSKIVNEPIFDIIRNGMATNVESFILANLDRFNEIAEKRPVHEEIGKRQMRGKYEGAFVFQPQPGLYENVCVFDFKGSYSSVIVSYNLSLTTMLEKKEKNSTEVEISDNKMAYFSQERGFFPIILEEIIKKRNEYKKEYQKNPNNLLKARSNAFKLLINASYGYLGFFGARYYCREAAAATAAMVKKNLLEVIDKIKKTNEVIYSDTDSIIFLYKSKEKTLEMLKKINENLPGIMELELEDFYSRGLFVLKRTGKEAAKKKYALLDEKGKLKIRGFETVRRDWCSLARNLQNKVLESVLKTGNEKEALELVKEIIEKVKKRQVEKKELIIRTQLRKPINEYVAISPHVIAAKKMEEQGIPVSQEMLIEYFIAESASGEKKKLVREGVALPDEDKKYDIEYYLDKQVLPAIENILDVFNVDIKTIIAGKKQMTLF
jgi:DNA polymerase Pol2